MSGSGPHAEPTLAAAGPGASLVRLLGASVAVLFAAQLLLAFFLPIYTDELGSKWYLARAFLDDGKAQIPTISCRQDPTTQWPALWMPARALDAFLYEDLSNPTKLRQLGFVYAFVFLAGLFILIRRASARLENGSVFLSYTLGLSFCALGVLPFLLVMNRPEGELMAGTIVLVMVVFAGVRNSRAGIIASVGLALVQYYLFAHHPNALLLIPLFLASWLTLPVPKVLKSFGIVMIGFLAFSLFSLYSQQLQCPLDNHVRILLLQNTLTPELFARFPEYFVWQGFHNFFGSLQYVRNIAFRDRYMSDWLPPNPLREEGLAQIANIAIQAMWLVPTLLLVAFMALLVTRKIKLTPREPGSECRAAIGMCMGLTISVALTCVAQINRNDYRSTQILLTILLAAVCATIGSTRSIPVRWWRGAFAAAFALCLLSQAVFFQSFSGRVQAWSVPGPTQDQFLSLNHLGYASFRKEIVALARQCDISELSPPPHLVLDEATYPVFWRSKLPYHLIYLIRGWGNGIPDLRALLEEHHFGGIVAQCRALPLSFQRLSKERKGICCMRPAVK